MLEHQEEPLFKVLAHREIVRRCVGFVSNEELPNNTRRSRRPFYLICSLTGKAIEKEGDGRQWHHMRDDLQRFICSKDCEVKGDTEHIHDEYGMQRWHLLRVTAKERKAGRESVVPDCRWVVDIAHYCTDQDEATRIKWNLKPHEELTEKHTPAQPGWNKRNDNIALLWPFPHAMRRITGAVNAARFGPLLTSFLAAMAPNAKGRVLVIKYAIEQLLLFEFQFTTDQHGKEYQWLPEHLVEWYAFHLLRRMFRMRFGCSMFPQAEPSGPILRMAPERDLAYQQYKKEVAKAWESVGQ